MEDNAKSMADLVISIIQLVVILISALWAFFRFRKEDPLYPRIEFDIDCKFFGPQHNFYIASFLVYANNKGLVEHKFQEIRLRVLGIKIDEPLKEFDKYPPMIAFPNEIMKGVNIVPERYKYFFVRPAVNQSFQYAAKIPADIRFIIVRATFKYQSANEIHSAEKVFEVKESTDK